MNIYLKSNLKRLLLFLILTFALICKTKPEEKYLWYSPREVISNADKLEPGDILILSKRPTLRSMWGHAAVLNENKKIVDPILLVIAKAHYMRGKTLIEKWLFLD